MTYEEANEHKRRLDRFKSINSHIITLKSDIKDLESKGDDITEQSFHRMLDNIRNKCIDLQLRLEKELELI